MANPVPALLDALADAIDGAWISDKLPEHDRLEQNLPAILVRDDAPGTSAGQPWGGAPILHQHAVDVEIYGRDVATIRALGEAVSAIIHATVRDPASPILTVRNPSIFHSRPDWNPRVARIGAEFTVTTATT